MTSHREIESQFCEPSDTSHEVADTLRKIVIGELPLTLPIVATLRTQAPYARNVRLSSATRQKLGLGEHADLHDLLHSFETKLRNPQQRQSFKIIDGATNSPFSDEYADQSEFEDVQEHKLDRFVAQAMKRQAHPAEAEHSDEAAPAETEAAPDVSEWRKRISGEQ